MAKQLKYKTAVGLSYKEEDDDTPLINVKGESLIADNIVKVAKRYGVPVIEKADLATALYKVDLDERIPESLFEPIAVILHKLKGVLKQ